VREKHDKAGEKKKEGEVGCESNYEILQDWHRRKIMRKERSFLMIKPEGVERGLIGEIIGRFERNGLKIVALKLSKISREVAEKQYEEHRGKDFFDDLVSYMSSAPTVSMVIEGENATAVAREP
jgi:nucleoside-diphosphate kinase